MLFKVGDLVKRTYPRYDYLVGIVVRIEKVGSKAIKFPACKNQTYETIWVKWTNLPSGVSWEEESYWAEDLQVLSSAPW